MSFSSKREVRAVLLIQNQSRAPIGRNKIERKRAWVSRNSDPRKRYTLVDTRKIEKFELKLARIKFKGSTEVGK